MFAFECPQVRVQALMNGEVIIKPLLDDLRPSRKPEPHWNPAYKTNQSPTRQGPSSPRRWALVWGLGLCALRIEGASAVHQQEKGN